MKSERNAVLWAAVLNCICAAVWDLNLALVLFYGWRSDSYLGLSIVTALIWNVIAIRFVVKYKKDKTDSRLKDDFLTGGIVWTPPIKKTTALRKKLKF